MSQINSRIAGFFKLPAAERVARVAAVVGMDEQALRKAVAAAALDTETADRMVENVLGVFGLPFAVALNFCINGVDVLVPMVVEEPSVVAAASHAAKRARRGGGFVVTATASLMAAQVAVHDVADPAGARLRLVAAEDELLASANAVIEGVVRRGGGAREIEVRDLGDGLIVLHVITDCLDAMGANMLNTVAEAIGDRVAELCRGRLGLRILSNYCDRRIVEAQLTIPADALADDAREGTRVAQGIVDASFFAERDPYRAVTHNKGIMNGVDAVVLATGNDWRAVEAAAHAYAARDGRYAPLSTWRFDGEQLTGWLRFPLAVGVVGGALRTHPGAALAIALLGVETAAELAHVVAAAGLATNLAALRALASEGIQRGHMALHHRACEDAADD
jgi:hydroxymethylglutaryl-CoA reductase